MTVQSPAGVLPGYFPPLPGADRVLTILFLQRMTVYFSVFFLFFFLIFFPALKPVTAEARCYSFSGKYYLLSGITLRNFYREMYSGNTAERKALLKNTSDELILQYAVNRLALFDCALDKDPSGLRYFSFIYPAEPDTGTRINLSPVKKTAPDLSPAETDALYLSIFLRLRYTYGRLLDAEEAETLEKDAILACEIKTALYQSILQLSPQDAAGVLRYIWGNNGIF